MQTIDGPDGKPRCAWCASTPEFVPYHDHEWGFPVDDDRRLFEKLSLEAFQSGLSWRTILNKREAFRAAFANFEIEAVAAFTETDVKRLLGNAGIVRHRGKIDAVINNAARAVELVAEAGSLAAFVWRYEEVSSLRLKRGRRHFSPYLSRKRSRNEAGVSSGQPPSTLSCRRWGW